MRRLPVVDVEGRPVGLVSRSDIFKPLGNYKRAMAAEVAAVQGAGSWQIKYLFDGSCPICSSMKVRALARLVGLHASQACLPCKPPSLHA